jgi:hypothetical protein
MMDQTGVCERKSDAERRSGQRRLTARRRRRRGAAPS